MGKIWENTALHARFSNQERFKQHRYQNYLYVCFRVDRDHFIDVIESNIQYPYGINFNKRTSNDARDIGDYDFLSIMHYPLNAFAIDSDRNTIVPIVHVTVSSSYRSFGKS